MWDIPNDPMDGEERNTQGAKPEPHQSSPTPVQTGHVHTGPFQTGLEKWASRWETPISVGDVSALCGKLELTTEDQESCWMLFRAYEKDEIPKEKLLQGMLEISGKTLEELIWRLSSGSPPA